VEGADGGGPGALRQNMDRDRWALEIADAGGCLRGSCGLRRGAAVGGRTRQCGRLYC
jgi:hypothetical protein